MKPLYEYTYPRIKFVHRRNYDDSGEPISTGGCCQAYQVDPESKKVTVAWAMCNDVDHYNKRIGRSITTSRLLLGTNDRDGEKYVATYPLKNDAMSPEVYKEVFEILDQDYERVWTEWCLTRGMEMVEEPNE